MKIQQIGISHEAIKLIRNLKKKTVDDLAILEDLSFFDFLMKENKKLECLIYCNEIIEKESTKKILDYFINNANEVYEISKKVYLSIVEKENSAGLIGIYKDNYLDISKIDKKKHKFIVVLDHLENPGNIGTMFRTCDGCKVDLLVSVDEIVNSSSYKVVQSSRGMSLFIDKIKTDYKSIQEFLVKNDYKIYLGEPIKGKSYQDYDYNENIAIVIGNERYGINPDWYNHNHLEVFIPMVGKMTSLNVSIAGSILTYEAFMKRNGNK